jgi:hyperosmotically inducible periplasmic protein
MKFVSTALVAILALAMLVGCSQQRANAPAAKDQVEAALNQNNLGDVKVAEDRDKGVITLSGNVKSDEDKQRAESLAKQAAPGRVIANEVGVRPAGAESTASKVDSNTDDAIENHMKALIAANNWNDQHIRFNAKNGVLTLKGDVDTPQQRASVEKEAANIPGVMQVVNELQVKGNAKSNRAGTPKKGSE